jgi:hypothetical protein
VTVVIILDYQKQGENLCSCSELKSIYAVLILPGRLTVVTNENGELTLHTAWCQTQTVVMDDLRFFLFGRHLGINIFPELINYSMSPNE